METLSVIIVSAMAVMWLLIVACMVCCHIHQLRERRRLGRIHNSYFKN